MTSIATSGGCTRGSGQGNQAKINRHPVRKGEEVKTSLFEDYSLVHSITKESMKKKKTMRTNT